MQSIAETLKGLGYTAEAISARTDIPMSRVVDILAGHQVTVADIRSISRGFGIPLRRLLSRDIALHRPEDAGALFRVGESNVADRDRGSTLDRVYDFVEAALSVLPKNGAQYPWLRHFAIENEDFEEAHRLAHRFRRLFMPGAENDPLHNLPVILDDLGVVLGVLSKSRFEGVSIVAGGYSFIFVARRFPARMLFTLAHELGHFLVHRNAGTKAVFEMPKQVEGRQKRSRSELFVDAFASILLLPDCGIGRTLEVIREHYGVNGDFIGDLEINLLARFFGVSFDVAAIRCEQLELMPRGGALELKNQIKKKFGSAERRAEALGLPPRIPVQFPNISMNLLGAVIDGIVDGRASIGWASECFGVSIGDIFLAHAKGQKSG